MVGRFTAFPDAARPIIHATNRGGVWTIDEDRAYVPYGGIFPSSGWDTRFAFEAQSKRIIGITWRSVFAASSQDCRFREAGGVDPEDNVRFHSATYIPRLDQTFLGTSHGLRVVDGETVKLVAGADRSVTGGVSGIFDLPSSPGIVLAGGGNRILLRGDDGTVEGAYVLARWRMRSAIGGDVVVSVDELPTPQTLLVRSHHETVLLEIDRTATTIRPKAAYSLQTFLCNRGADGSRDLLSSALGSYLIYGRTSDGACPMSTDRRVARRLERLQDRSFVPVPGGELQMSGGQPLHDLPTLGIVLLKTVRDVDRGFGNGGLLAYDGDRVAPVPDSGREHIGDFVWVYDVRSVGKVLLVSDKGLFELSADRTIRRIETPSAFSFQPIPVVAEMPASGLAILVGSGGVLSLDSNAEMRQVPGSENFVFSPARPVPGIIPTRNELLLTGRNGLFLVVDQNLAADSVCQ